MDCTYSRGQFYKNGDIKQPPHKTDLTPQTDDTIQADSSALPFEDNKFNCVMFDPPFVISGKTYKDSANPNKNNVMANRFGCYFTYDELKTHYSLSLKEIYRVLENDGICIFKVQNTISSGKQYMNHFFVLQEALRRGFYIKDEFILSAKSKITSFGGRWTNQIHAMKYHSYFLVLQKSKKNIDYSFNI